MLVARLRSRAPRDLPKNGNREFVKSTTGEDHRWRHQREAVDTFLRESSGILEMATGTGKTRTALRIMDQLIQNGSTTASIISADGNDLLDQWCLELDAWLLDSGRPWILHRHFAQHKGLGSFILDHNKAILVISRAQLHRVLPRIPAATKDRMIIVHDEVHGLGVPTSIELLKGQHSSFRWRLGLSATPERAYDDRGNKFIEKEIGPTIFEFPLERAISRGVLCGFEYVPLHYELTDGDRKRLRDVFARRSARAHDGSPMTNEEFWRELSKVYKTAEMKPDTFAPYLADHPEIIQRCIVFVETKEYGNSLLGMIHEHTSLYRTYYAEDERDHLIQFARGEIDCLITCHRVSQGIDIQSLQSVVLFASARSKLETIQRIGRCLRANPDNPAKRAVVVDFVRPATPGSKGESFPNADVERCEWLRELSKVRRKDDA